MNQEVNGMSALGGCTIILGFISLMFYEVAYITPVLFIIGTLLFVAGIMSGDSK